MAWNPILCTRADLEQEVGDLTLWTQVNEPECAALVNQAIATVGRNITSELSASLPELFVTTLGLFSTVPLFSDWLLLRGYSYDDLDAVLDEIINPEVLKPWAIARAIHQLSVQMIGKFQVLGSQTLSVMVDQRAYWGGKPQDDGDGGVAGRRKIACVKLLKVDLNKDGKIQDFGRPRTHTVWQRG